MATPLVARDTALKLIYRHAHKDAKGKLAGVPTLLVYRNGTCLVNLQDLTEAEIADRLPMALKAEEARLAKKRGA